ncbi:MAG: hypothetical protein V4438_03925 [Patescibacteria group bacterium]
MKTILLLLSAFAMSVSFAWAEDVDYSKVSLKYVLMALRDSEGSGRDSLGFLKEINSFMDELEAKGEANRELLEHMSMRFLIRYKSIRAKRTDLKADTVDLESYLMIGILAANNKANSLVGRISFKLEEFKHFRSDIDLIRARSMDPDISGAAPNLDHASELAERVFSPHDPRFVLSADGVRLLYFASVFMDSWDWKQQARTFRIAAALALEKATIEKKEEVTSAK